VTPRPDPRVGTDLGPYRIESVIGRGGMGVVYLATHRVLDRRVALKLLAPDYADDEAFRARFLRESRMAAAIDHPNIIPIYEAGEFEGVYFLAMRYVAGTDLETRLAAGPVEPREAVHLLGQVASALDAAHEQGLTHRDVKPANVLIAAGKGVERADHAYLTDFGLTKQRGSETGLTQSGAFMGTLDYIAPEQIEGKPVDGRADQYGLACVAFQCLTGRAPFTRETDIATAMAHLREAPPSAVEIRPDLPAAADAVLARALAKRPGDRFPSCESFVAALRQALGVRPTEEHRVAGADRGRRPLLAAGAAAVVLVAVAALLLGSGRLGIGAGSAPTAAPATVAGPVASPSGQPPATGAASATADTYPNAPERALLAQLAAAPDGFAGTCHRGSYASVPPGLTPLASLECTPDTASGASEVVVRRFGPTTSGGGFSVRLVFGLYPFVGIPPGDCARESPAIGTWSIAGQVRGTRACYTQATTGDALLWWSHDSDELLIMARNPRGDSRALYAFFDRNAKFISP
jgi:serine/threonine-protein kinase